MRHVRKGASNYADKQKISAQKIESSEEKIREINLSIPFSEHMLIMHHAMQELLVLAGNPEGYSVKKDNKYLYFDTPRGVVKVAFLINAQHLLGINDGIYGGELWELYEYDKGRIEYPNMNELIRALKAYIV